MMKALISAEIEKTVSFYDVDSMDIVWHGNYAKFLEDARCALLEKIEYDYDTMKKTGYGWPIVNMNIKYIKPCKFRQKLIIRANLIEYENCIKVKYEIVDAENGDKISKAETMQMAVDMSTMKSCFCSPKILIDKVNNYVERKNND